MTHWESMQIVGEWVSVQATWYVRVECDSYRVEPDALEGRCITVKGLRQRLGDLIPGHRGQGYYYTPWRTEDFSASPALRERLRAGATLDGAERDAWERDLRQDLKNIAARVRNFRTGPKSISAWQRWALEPLDDALLWMAGSGLGPLPLDCFKPAAITDFGYLASQLEWYRRA